MYHVKETTKPVPGGLDMNVADEDEFSPDKLRATMERLYMTVVRIHVLERQSVSAEDCIGNWLVRILQAYCKASVMARKATHHVLLCGM